MKGAVKIGAVVLLLGLVAGSVPPALLPALAQDSGTEEHVRGYGLVIALRNAVERVSNIFETWGLPDDHEAWNTLSEINASIDQVEAYLLDGNIQDAKDLARELFTQLGDLVSSVAEELGIEVEVDEITEIFVRIHILNRTINALEKAAERLLTKEGVDTEALNQSLEILSEARQELSDIFEYVNTTAPEDINVTYVNSVLDEIESKIETAKELIQTEAAGLLREKAREILAKALERIDFVIEKLNNTITHLREAGATRVATALEGIYERLTEIRGIIEDLYGNITEETTLPPKVEIALIASELEMLGAFHIVAVSYQVGFTMMEAHRMAIGGFIIAIDELNNAVERIINLFPTLPQDMKDKLLNITSDIDNFVDLFKNLSIVAVRGNEEGVEELKLEIQELISEIRTEIDELLSEGGRIPGITQYLNQLDRLLGLVENKLDDIVTRLENVGRAMRYIKVSRIVALMRHDIRSVERAERILGALYEGDESVNEALTHLENAEGYLRTAFNATVGISNLTVIEEALNNALSELLEASAVLEESHPDVKAFVDIAIAEVQITLVFL
jgi:pimeloyl-CoA synthetase